VFVVVRVVEFVAETSCILEMLHEDALCVRVSETMTAMIHRSDCKIR
jgi:hypothetical protein